MNIKIFILTNNPESFFLQAAEEYLKRLSRFCRISVKYYKNLPKLIKDVSAQNNLFILDPSGEMLSSEMLAEAVRSMEINGNSRIAVAIADGINETIGADVKRIALSRMYMPPALTEVVALEQIYRAFKIIRGETYHK